MQYTKFGFANEINFIFEFFFLVEWNEKLFSFTTLSHRYQLINAKLWWEMWFESDRRLIECKGRKRIGSCLPHDFIGMNWIWDEWFSFALLVCHFCRWCIETNLEFTIHQNQKWNQCIKMNPFSPHPQSVFMSWITFLLYTLYIVHIWMNAVLVETLIHLTSVFLIQMSLSRRWWKQQQTFSFHETNKKIENRKMSFVFILRDRTYITSYFFPNWKSWGNY